MTEEGLHAAEIRSGIEEMSGKRVSQFVGRDVEGNGWPVPIVSPSQRGSTCFCACWAACHTETGGCIDKRTQGKASPEQKFPAQAKGTRIFLCLTAHDTLRRTNIARDKNTYAKRNRELEKKAKAEAKRVRRNQRKQSNSAAPEEGTDLEPNAPDADSSEQSESN